MTHPFRRIPADVLIPEELVEPTRRRINDYEPDMRFKRSRIWFYDDLVIKIPESMRHSLGGESEQRKANIESQLSQVKDEVRIGRDFAGYHINTPDMVGIYMTEDEPAPGELAGESYLVMGRVPILEQTAREIFGKLGDEEKIKAWQTYCSCAKLIMGEAHYEPLDTRFFRNNKFDVSNGKMWFYDFFHFCRRSDPVDFYSEGILPRNENLDVTQINAEFERGQKLMGKRDNIAH